MKYKTLLLILGIAVSVSACSNRQLYNAVQENRKAKCDELPDVPRAECLEQYLQSYEEYERGRREVLAEPLNCAGDAVNCR